ncbi:hypothetical protein [Rhodopseudomonas sp. RCAM05734]|uniref:hypothetical protein n=1 Tax=Rhodopseudomonas sp. RCAM05734 TaxID=3457549 RepID=UPI00404413D1
MDYIDFLDKHPNNPTNAVELPEFGYISPNQFSDEEFQHPAIEEMLTAAEATAAAQEIANQLSQPVKVEYRHQFCTGHGFEAPHRSQVFNPGQWPSLFVVRHFETDQALREERLWLIRVRV